MANLCPPDMTFEPGRLGEGRVYQLLAEALPEPQWWVFYNLRFYTDASCTTSREIDFAIVHPQRGCLFVEVKGGQYLHDPNRGWCKMRHGHVEPDVRHGGPYGQINSAAYALLGVAGRALGFDHRKPPFRWGVGVAFPGTTLRRVDGRLPADAEGDITAEEAIFDTPQRLRAWVLRRFKQLEQKFPSIGNDSASWVEQLITNFLAPRVEHLSRLASQIARCKGLEALLTIEQRAVMRLLASRSRVLIGGYAGTGKTFMAVHRAVTLRDQPSASGTRPKIAILCFNANLASLVRKEMLPPGTDIEAVHFHEFVDTLSSEVGLAPVHRRDQTYFETGCVARLEEAWLTGRMRQFDAVLVDEGQDFRPDWLQAIEDCILRPGGSLFVFFDPFQDVYRIGQHLSGRFGSPYPITTNCRNTAAICHFVKQIEPQQLADLHSAEHIPAGCPPQIIRYTSQSDQCNKIEALIADLVDQHDLRPRQIVLMSPYRREKTCLAEHDVLRGYRLIDFSRRYSVTSPHVLLYETVASFKGIDADAVIVHDLGNTSWATDPMNLYVAFSRARFGLYILAAHDMRRF